MPRAAYLIPGRGGLWAGWRRDVRRFRRFRFRRRRFRRLRSPGWVAAVGRATHPRPTRDPPATGWPPSHVIAKNSEK